MIKIKKIKLFAVLMTFIFLLGGCSPKVYEENQLFARGINSGYTFDTIENDRLLIDRIKKGNREYFNYILTYGVDKIGKILTDKKQFDTKNAIKAQNSINNSYNNYGTANNNNNIIFQVAKDYKNGVRQ